MVAVPDRQAAIGDGLRLFQLGPEEGSRHLSRQERGTHLLPGVFIYLAPEESTAIGTFFADDLGLQCHCGIIDQQRPPSPEITFLVS